jgi:predicted negative regulator of RcsB-dependent stress response
MSVALLLVARLCLPLAAGQAPFEPAVVKLERRDGVELWTVRAKEASVRALLARVAELSGRAIDAGSSLERAPLVTIALERRPLAQVLEFALGSAGLLTELHGEIHAEVGGASPAVIRVRPDRADEETSDQRAGLAAAAWARAAARYPRHPVAAAARLAQGELAELSGRTDAARERYLDLLARAPASPSASEAYLRAGRIAAERGAWAEASEHFRALANLPGAEEYRAVARVELARATLALGDAASALHILDALDASHPCWEKTELTARALVRIDALLVERRFQDALLALEARAPDLDPLGTRELPRLRARALEGAGLAEEAARAWLLVAREAQGPTSVAAFRTAARLAEESGDPVAVLYVVREAETAGFGACVAEAERRARAELGVEPAPVDTSPRARTRLAQAEGWLEKHDLERAAGELEALFQERELLDLFPDERARLALGWTRCLAAVRGIDAATEVARSERARVEASEARARLDRGMAGLFEEHGLFERAADAYRGDY